MKFGLLQLRNETWAEDAASEMTLAALAKPHAFANHSQLKTWLIGNLNHKVVDSLRQHGREISQIDTNNDHNEDPSDYLGIKADGHFAWALADWGNPEQQACSKQFIEVLKTCANQIPAVLGRLLLTREWLESSSEEICKELELTLTNLYVQLHRTRLRLRDCLEVKWHEKTSKQGYSLEEPARRRLH